MNTRKISSVFSIYAVFFCVFLPLVTPLGSVHAQNLQITQLQSLNGTPGTSFTIYGANFDATPSDNTVTFTPAGGGSGTSATVTSASSTALIVTIPVVAGGNYMISVQRASDASTVISPEVFAVTTGGGYFGTPNSSEKIVSSTVFRAIGVYAGDVDGDGDIDIMSASRDDDKIAWYESDGAPTPSFTERIVSTNADEAEAVYAADVDGDGDLDLMSASSNDDKIAWYENDGAVDPNFTERVVSTSAYRARSVYAGDVDGDGDLDLMSASNFDQKIAWYENDGLADPTFTERIVSINASGAFNVHAGDVDGDGDLDLILALASNLTHNIAWYENDGAVDPTFTERVVSTSALNAVSVHAGDVDGDGDLDLMSASYGDDKIAWYENDGAVDPTFTERVVSTSALTAVSVYAGDMDGDGDLDLMSASLDDDKIAWYENDGSHDPTFTESIVSTTTNGARGLYARDLDSDGDLDMVTASFYGNKIAWHENESPPSITKVQPLNGTPGRSITIYGNNFSSTLADNTVTFTPVGGGSGTTASVTAASPTKLTVTVPDVTGGNYTISVKNSSNAIVATSPELFSVTTFGGDFGLSGTSDRIVNTTLDAAFSIYAADIDGDGDLDMMSASGLDDTIAWHENNGAVNPTFIERIVTTTALGVHSVYAADVDGDGDMDLMSASTQDNKIVWYENNGSQTFTERVVSTNAMLAESVYAADVDGDGDLDLMSASRTDNKIAWYENDGGFGAVNSSERVISTTASGAMSVYAADMDDDGDIDLMSASLTDDKIAWYENDGGIDPTFTERVVSNSADNARSVYAADIDGDGDLDLMSASYQDDKIAWYENDGGFGAVNSSERVVSTSANGAEGVYAADVDSDGDLDLMSASQFSDKIAWYENDGGFGAVNSSERVVSTNANGAVSVYAGDLDGDGDLDLMSASYQDDKIAWYENEPISSSVTKVQPLNGTPGRSITIYGSDFSSTLADNTVTFTPVGGGSGTKASITAASPTKLTVTVPDVTGGNYSITVQRAGSVSSDISSEQFAVTTSGGFFGAIGSSEKIVSTAALGAARVRAADLDGDGDQDLVSASFEDDKIIWYESDGAAAPSFTEWVISTNANNVRSVYVADVDGDGDLDIMSASINDDKIAWYESDGAADPTFTERVVSTTADGAVSVYAGDLDGDGDMDIMSASAFNDTIAWYENDGATDPSFIQRIVSTTADRAESVYAGDVDGDGDMDIMSASAFDDTIAWYENDGAADPVFTERIVSTTADGAESVYAEDVDGDGDLDIMSASQNDNKIAWYENDGSADPVFTERIISMIAGAAKNMSVGDMDGDGDIDLLFAVPFGNKIVWHENDGASDPSFTERVVSTTASGAYGIYAADLDNDGDLEILSASANDDKIAWYENKSILNVSGRSVQLDGSTGYIDIPDSLAEDLGDGSDLTLEAWIKPDYANQGQTLAALFAINSADYGNTLLLTLDNAASASAGQIRVLDGTGDVNNFDIVSPKIADNQWIHVAYTLNGTTGILYLDGEEIGQHTQGVPLSTTDLWSFGQEFDRPGGAKGNHLKATVDELRVWNIARTQQEIHQTMFQALKGDEQGLFGYWKLDRTDGDVLMDETTNNNHSTLTGNATIGLVTYPNGTLITGNEGWRMITSPVGDASYGQILDTLWTQGFTGADATNGTSNVYTWSESAQQFVSISDTADVPIVGGGFIIYVYDDDNNDEVPDGFPKTLKTESTQRTGSVSSVLSFTSTGTIANDGWNLMGNPYGATIDWDATFGWSKNNIDASFYVWSDSAGGGAGDYKAWNGITGTFGGGEIAPFQGFWVKANATSPGLSFTDDIRSGGGVLLKQAPIPEIKFSLKDSALSSNAIVMFHELASIEKDALDAYKLQSLNPDFLSLFTELPDGTGLDINALPIEMEEPLSIPMDFDGSNLAGSFELYWSPKSLPSGMSLMLVDTETGTEIDLTQASSYAFEIENQAKIVHTQNIVSVRDNGSPQNMIGIPTHSIFSPQVLKAKSAESGARFEIQINGGTSVGSEPGSDLPATVELDQNYPNPFNPSTTINFAVPEQANVQLVIFDMLGRKVADLVNEPKSVGRYSVNFDASGLASGLYIYRLQVGTKVLTKKMMLIK